MNLFICLEINLFFLKYNIRKLSSLYHSLTMLTGKNCVFIHFSTRMDGWRLLIFLIYLHNQLSSIIHPIYYVLRYRCLKNVIHQIDSRNARLPVPASFTEKIWVGFCLNTGKYFLILKPTKRA